MANTKNSKFRLKWLGFLLIITGLVSFSNHPVVSYAVFGIGVILLIIASFWPQKEKQTQKSD